MKDQEPRERYGSGISFSEAGGEGRHDDYRKIHLIEENSK